MSINIASISNFYTNHIKINKASNLERRSMNKQRNKLNFAKVSDNCKDYFLDA